MQLMKESYTSVPAVPTAGATVAGARAGEAVGVLPMKSARSRIISNIVYTDDDSVVSDIGLVSQDDVTLFQTCTCKMLINILSTYIFNKNFRELKNWIFSNWVS